MSAVGTRRLSTSPSAPMAKTASPSSSWICSGGSSRCITASSSTRVTSAPCSSSTLVTNAVNPEISAKIRNPSSLISVLRRVRHRTRLGVKAAPLFLFPPARPQDPLVLDRHLSVLDHPGPERLGGHDVLEALAVPDDEVGATAGIETVVAQAQDPGGVHGEAADQRAQIGGRSHVRGDGGEKRHVDQIGRADRRER